jgi:histidine triad (HIT) family protein
MKIIDDMIDNNRDGIYLRGKDVSLADVTLFPTMVFAKYMLPKFGEKEPLPPKINAWFDNMVAQDLDFRRVHDEVYGGIKAWEERGRWNDIWMAGLRDTEPATIFDRILAGEIPASVVKEDSHLLAFKDINPAAPAHVLVIPKDRMNLTRLQKSSPEHIEILGRLMVAAGEISRDESLGFGDGARIVVNDGPDGGQEISHLHIHVLGGRKMTWPPG